jgi:hypothetical protein
MLWLIWIAIMLLTPVIAGVQVWLQINHPPVDAPETSSAGGIAEPRSSEV